MTTHRRIPFSIKKKHEKKYLNALPDISIPISVFKFKIYLLDYIFLQYLEQLSFRMKSFKNSFIYIHFFLYQGFLESFSIYDPKRNNLRHLLRFRGSFFSEIEILLNWNNLSFSTFVRFLFFI